MDTDSTPEELVFNRTVTLRDSYGKAGGGQVTADLVRERVLVFAWLRTVQYKGGANWRKLGDAIL